MHNKSPSQNSKEKLNKLSEIKNDVFDLGSLLLVAAVGGFDIIKSTEFDQNINKENICCIIHKNSDNKTDIDGINFSDYLNENKFSKEFLDFLCKCLQFKEAERATISDLIKHPWIKEKTNFKTPEVTLQELIMISNQWRLSSLPIQFQGPSEKQLDRVCEAMASVIPSCENYEKILLMYLKGDETVAKELATDLGMDEKRVWNQIKKAISPNSQQV